MATIKKLPLPKSKDSNSKEFQLWMESLKTNINNINTSLEATVTDIASALVAIVLLNLHKADTTIHFTEASINHTDIQNIGTNTHTQIDTHLANTSNPHSVTYTQAGAAPTAKGVTNGDSHDHSGGDGAQINHTTLSSIGTNTHAQVDTAISNSVTHIADTTIHAANLPEAALTTQLTGITHTAPVEDFVIQDLVNVVPYGFVTKDEGNTVLKVIANLQTRVAELELRLQNAGILS